MEDIGKMKSSVLFFYISIWVFKQMAAIIRSKLRMKRKRGGFLLKGYTDLKSIIPGNQLNQILGLTPYIE